MATLFSIGIILIVLKLIHIALKAAWGITKCIFFIVGFPLFLIILFVVGLASLAFPLLILGLLVSFLFPGTKGF